MIDISKITWGTILFDPDDSEPDYIGLHQNSEANTADNDWVIYKVTYKGANITKTQMTKGSYDNRKSLFK